MRTARAHTRKKVVHVWIRNPSFSKRSILYMFIMNDKSFFKKVISYLAELNKGKHNRLVENGWLSEDEVFRIKIILCRLGFLQKRGDDCQITRKGLNVLLYIKMGKMNPEYDDRALEMLLSIQ